MAIFYFLPGFSVEVQSVQTVDDTVTTIWSSPIVADGEAYLVEASVLGSKSDGSQRGLYHIEGAFYRNGGNVIQQNSTTSFTMIESDTDWNIAFDVDIVNQKVLLTVKGKAATTVNWKTEVKYSKV